MNLTKTNRTKLIARVMLVILILVSSTSFVGCARGADKYAKVRYYQPGHFSPIDMMVSSNSKTFLKDDVTFNLSYGFQKILYDGEFDNRVDYNYFIEEYELIYGLYIANDDYYKTVINSHWYTNDIENIEGCQFVRQISEEEALSDDYWVVTPHFAYGYGFREFKHTEKITIPREYVNNPSGYFYIIITMFGITNDGSYVALESVKLECYYKELDENTIEIDMEDWKYFRIMKPLFE